MLDETHTPNYRGRFAPSPTGPLHFGSLVAAVSSFLQARSQDGEWLLRIEDIDPPREVPGSISAILYTLEAYGFTWDGPVSYQSKRTAVYQEALNQLETKKWLYPCGCSRKTIAATLAENYKKDEDRPQIYPGTCRKGLAEGQQGRVLRVITQDAKIDFNDAVQGHIRVDLEQNVGDFILRRADGLFAYQLAVAIDDAGQGITEVVRGADLLDSTPRQIHVQQLLGLFTPYYAHVPMATNKSGEKLSKHTHAPALDDQAPVTALWRALLFLGQQPPQALQSVGLDEFWQWAISHWSLSTVPHTHAIQVK